ncbi:MAG: hypothetical protein IJW21_06915 [Clostridia bacterium]|nr:hypothetical protein [Clostridia bacterium]
MKHTRKRANMRDTSSTAKRSPFPSRGRLLLALAAMLLALTLLCFVSCGEAKGPFVYVTVANQNGEIAARYEKVAYTEGMTIDAALAALHAEKCEGGYASAESAYGLSMTKLWGVENGGSYGYYVNNASATSLADTLKEGDHVYAFVYTDTVTFSDTYAFFASPTAEAAKGESLELALSYCGYDANWAPVTMPVEGAKILVDGAATTYKTNAEGKVSIKFDKAGTYVVTATSDTANLVPPFVIVTVK